MLCVRLMRARDDHISETNVEPIYYCNIGPSESWVHNIIPWTHILTGPSGHGRKKKIETIFFR